jgi:hypothetical protein
MGKNPFPANVGNPEINNNAVHSLAGRKIIPLPPVQEAATIRRIKVQDINSPLHENDCTELFKALHADLSWQWDDRFETALAQISIAEKDAVGKTLENHLGKAWDSATIDTAPEKVRHIIGQLGGIMAGQLLYAAGLPQDGIIFCAWWPWGNGQTISIRLGTSQDGSALLAALVPLEAR